MLAERIAMYMGVILALMGFVLAIGAGIFEEPLAIFQGAAFVGCGTFIAAIMRDHIRNEKKQ